MYPTSNHLSSEFLRRAIFSSMGENYTPFYSLIISLRKPGESRRAFAKRLGRKDPGTITNWERGRIPTAKAIYVMCEFADFDKETKDQLIRAISEPSTEEVSKAVQVSAVTDPLSLPYSYFIRRVLHFRRPEERKKGRMGSFFERIGVSDHEVVEWSKDINAAPQARREEIFEILESTEDCLKDREMVKWFWAGKNRPPSTAKNLRNAQEG
jgi:hypothetical protein